ncbi:unnamed protein product [Allacma fusca]|uniref:Uncharacterized protein n=1 Tax=Allacma fusca TaxID=39272 RepID=A0A8J2KCZ7_9HEXA|nr:unnamed protein product [Allacma fusca]
MGRKGLGAFTILSMSWLPPKRSARTAALFPHAKALVNHPSSSIPHQVDVVVVTEFHGSLVIKCNFQIKGSFNNHRSWMLIEPVMIDGILLEKSTLIMNLDCAYLDPDLG